jgi:hypothetical protein
MVASRILIVALCLVALGACSRQSEERCQQACWNHYELTFLERIEQEAAALPEDEREAFLVTKRSELDAAKADKDYGPAAVCTVGCTKRATSKQIDCLIAATTATEVRACTD